MSIFDGLLFWLGKMIAEFLVTAALVIGIVILAVWLESRAMRIAADAADREKARKP